MPKKPASWKDAARLIRPEPDPDPIPGPSEDLEFPDPETTDGAARLASTPTIPPAARDPKPIPGGAAQLVRTPHLLQPATPDPRRDDPGDDAPVGTSTAEPTPDHDS